MKILCYLSTQLLEHSDCHRALNQQDVKGIFRLYISSCSLILRIKDSEENAKKCAKGKHLFGKSAVKATLISKANIRPRDSIIFRSTFFAYICISSRLCSQNIYINIKE